MAKLTIQDIIQAKGKRQMHYTGEILPPGSRKEVSFNLQPEQEFGLDEEIPLKAREGGWVLIAEEANH